MLSARCRPGLWWVLALGILGLWRIGGAHALPLLLTGPAPTGGPSVWQVASPDGRVSLAIHRTGEDGGRLRYAVAVDGIPVLAPSPLGVVLRGRGGDLTTGLSVLTETRRSLVDTFQARSGKRACGVARANEMALWVRNASGREMVLVARAYNDGVALRYLLPGTGLYRVTREATGFHLPPDTHGWAQAWTPDGEREYHRRTAAELAEGDWGYPILLEGARGTWALLSEAALTGSYAGLHFRGTDAEAPALKLIFPFDQRTPIGGSLPLETPWRVVVVGRTLASVVESDLIRHLNPPSRLGDDSWVRPGRVAWSWWGNSRTRRSLEEERRYTDFAREMGWEYVLVDVGWDADWIPDLVRYAGERGIGVLLWSRASLFNESRAARWAGWGIAGIKLDFVESDRQEAFRSVYDAMYRATARHRLLLNFHGSARPTGAERTWPQHLTREGVKGAEHGRVTSAHNVNLVFTRNVIGPMDYTPGVLTPGKASTTFAHQIALAVLYESGLQHFCDTPERYRGSPARELLRQVPAAWDDIRFVSGRPAAADRPGWACVARRKGENWFVGAITTEAGPMRIPLAFLDPGARYQATLYVDGRDDTAIDVTTRIVRAADTLTVPLRRHGGCAISLHRIDPATP